jgi:DNA gyrase subunit B
MTAIVSVKLPKPQFEGQTKAKLGNSEVKGLVENLVYEELSAFLEENPAVAKNILTKVTEAARAREAARKAKELTRRRPCGYSPGKLAGARNGTPNSGFILLRTRLAVRPNRKDQYQAILPLRKILNEKARFTK